LIPYTIFHDFSYRLFFVYNRDSSGYGERCMTITTS